MPTTPWGWACPRSMPDRMNKWTITGRAYGGLMITTRRRIQSADDLSPFEPERCAEAYQVQGPGVDDRFTYDANGNRASHHRCRRTVTTYVYTIWSGIWRPSARRHPTPPEPARSRRPGIRSIAFRPRSRSLRVAGVNLVTQFTYDAPAISRRRSSRRGRSVREWNYTVNARGQVLTIDGPRTDVTDVVARITYYADDDACVGCRGRSDGDERRGSGDRVQRLRPGRPSDPGDRFERRGDIADVHAAGLARVADRRGETTAYDYDFAGNLAKVTLPTALWWPTEYDCGKRPA